MFESAFKNVEKNIEFISTVTLAIFALTSFHGMKLSVFHFYLHEYIIN